MNQQSQERAAASQQKRERERDPRVDHRDGTAEGDSRAAKRERRPEIPPAAGSEKTDEGVIGEIVNDDQEAG